MLYFILSAFEEISFNFIAKIETLDNTNIGGSKCVNKTKKKAIDNLLKTIIDEKFKIEVDE